MGLSSRESKNDRRLTGRVTNMLSIFDKNSNFNIICFLIYQVTTQKKNKQFNFQ